MYYINLALVHNGPAPDVPFRLLDSMSLRKRRKKEEPVRSLDVEVFNAVSDCGVSDILGTPGPCLTLTLIPSPP